MVNTTGGPADDRIIGGADPDTLNGGGGGDTVFGGAGDDLIIGDLVGGSAPDGTLFFEFFNFNNNINTVDVIDGATPTDSGVATDTDVDALVAQFGQNGTDLFAVRYTGIIDVQGGSYRFETSSDDGSTVFIDGVEVVDNDGLHGIVTVDGTVNLTPGEHDIEIRFFENTGGESLAVRVEGPETNGEEELFASGIIGDPNNLAVLTAGDDSLLGGEGDDSIEGGLGDDTLEGGGDPGGSLFFEFYNLPNSLSTVDDVPTAGEAASGFISEIDIDALAFDFATNGGGGGNPEFFAVRYTGQITIDTAGDYDFGVRSDDGSKLFIDGALVVDNDGVHAPATVTDTVNLTAGTHDIVFVMFENAGQQVLDVTINGPDTGNATIDLFASGVVSSNAPQGPSGNDTLVGGEGSDNFTGGDGDDRFEGFGGGGGVSDDILDFTASDDVVALGGFFTNLKELRDNAVEVGPDTFITLADGAEVVLRGTTIDSLNTANTEVPCFTTGAMIATPYGRRAIEDLTIGDMVLTMDNGPQPIRWTGARHLNVQELEASPHLRPVVIRAGALGPGLPVRDLRVSPQHRMMLDGLPVKLMFGQEAALVPAIGLVGRRGVRVAKGARRVTYRHLMFDHHQIIYADGAPSESLHPGDRALTAIGAAARAEVFEIFPSLRLGCAEYGGTARKVLRRYETQVLAATR